MASLSQQNQIAVARKTLEVSVFDRETCKEGIRALKKYQFEFDEDRQRYRDTPLHDWASDYCDAFELGGQVWKTVVIPESEKPPVFPLEQPSGKLFWPDDPGYKGEERI